MTVFDQGVPTAPGAWQWTIRDASLVEYDGLIDGYDAVHAALLQDGQPGAWDMTLPLAHPAVALLLTPGYGVVARQPGTGQVMTSGYVQQQQTTYQQGADGHSQVTVQGPDDNAVMASEVAWADPGKWLNDGTSQNVVSGTVDARTGLGEDVLIGYLEANMGATAFHSGSTTPPIDRRRNGILTIPASAHHGTSGSYQAAFGTLLSDIAATICGGAGITCRVAQDVPGKLKVIVRARADVSADVVFSQAEGSLQAASYTDVRPSITAGIAVSDSGTVRSYAMVIDTAAETRWATRFVATTDGDSNVIADLLQAATDLVATGTETAGASIVPVQLPAATQYGVDYQLGDLVTVVDLAGNSIVDQLAQVTYSHESGSAPVLVPSVGISPSDGSGADTVAALVPLIRQLQAAVRQLNRR